MDWDDISNLINKEFRQDDIEYKEAAYRKPYSGAKRYYEAGVFNKLDEETYFKELLLQRQELEKEKVKIRDERNELMRVIREEARKESYQEQIIRSIQEYQAAPLSYDSSRQFNGMLKTDNDIIATFFDVHTGIDINNFWNEFNDDVLSKRIRQYIDKIFEVQLRHDSENAHIILSELVSGIIHLSLRIENNQNLINQFLTITNYLSQFLTELSYHFNTVHVYICPGNHSRISPKKEDSLKGENIDLLALPFLEAKLQNFSNIKFHTNTIDESIAIFNVRGQKIFAVHGDKDSPESVVQRLTMYTSIKPDIIYMGHKHTNGMWTAFDSKVIQAGCMSGPDNYCMDKRLRNKPEQVISIVTEKGLDCLYNVVLT